MKSAIDVTVLLEALNDFNVRQDEGKYKADCPVCNQEGNNKGTGKLVITPEGKISCMRFVGHDDSLMKEHRRQILSTLGVGESESFKDYDLGNNYTLRISKKASHNKNSVIVIHEGETVAVDAIRIDKDVERKKFIKSLTVGQQITDNISKRLTEVAGQSIISQSVEDNEPKKLFLGFFTLPDGRIAEMTRAGFAVYDPNIGETELRQVLEFDGDTYLMPRDPIFFYGWDDGIQLPPNVIEYGDDHKLMEEIEGYIARYVDFSNFWLKLAAAYVKFTYIADKTYELPYLRIVGMLGAQSKGSGKSRLANVLGRICYRPFKVTDPSASSTFRLMNQFHPTLVIDEFNFSGGGDDASQLIKILNTGFQRGSMITRSVRDEVTGEIVVEGFSPYGPKVIGGLTTIDSSAFESRAIRVEMKKTARKDIQFRTSQAQLNEAARLRGMLTLWRLRNYQMDVEEVMDRAENALKSYNIEPRYIQIGTPLYSVLGSEKLENQLAEMLVERTIEDAQDRRQSIEGTLAFILHRMLFEQENDRIVWSDKSLCVEGDPCPLITVKDITAKYNAINDDEKPKSAIAIGKILKRDMQLRTKTIEKTVQGKGKAAVIFHLEGLVYQFKQYSLDLPEDIPTFTERADEALTKSEEKKASIRATLQGAGNKEDTEKTSHFEQRKELLNDLQETNPQLALAWEEIEDGDIEEDSAHALTAQLTVTENRKKAAEQLKSVSSGEKQEVSTSEPKNPRKSLGYKPLERKKLQIKPRGAKNLLANLSAVTVANKKLNLKTSKKEQNSGNDTPTNNERKFKRGDFKR